MDQPNFRPLRPLYTAEPLPELPVFGRPDQVAEPLYVVTAIFNTPRFRVRWKLYEDFAKRVLESGAVLYTIECAFGDREFTIVQEDVCTDPSVRHRVIRVRTPHELWVKENLLNLAVARLPLNWKYVAWIDSDLSFARDDWANEAVHTLQHYPIIQMFSHALDLDPNSRPHGDIRRCFVDVHNDDEQVYYGGNALVGAAGLAWACRREAWDALGGLFDQGILGASDWYMAHALYHNLDKILKHRAYAQPYKDLMIEWQGRADREIRQNIGVMPGLILHHWHGAKLLRQYRTRERILVENKFDPHVDLKRDWQGVYQLTGRSIRLRDEVRKYFHARDEDSTDVSS